MLRRLVFALVVLGAPLRAEVPQVATDIAPVQGLAAMVMGDLGTPGQVMPAGASPHDHALRPSEAALLQQADVVFWIGPALSPAMERPLASLADQAQVVVLADVPGVHVLERREEAVFEVDEDDHDHSHEDGDGHEGEHQEEHEEEHGHGHDHSGDFDPHLWLDPDNAILWLDVMAETLAGLDPANAASYRENATLGVASIKRATEAARARMAPMQGRAFVAFHDAYAYFEAAFGLRALGSIALSDAAPPSPKRLSALRDGFARSDIACVLAEPQYTPGLVAAVSEGTERRVVLADPMGADLPPGAEFYPALIGSLAESFADCAQGG